MAKINPIKKTINYSLEDLAIVADCLEGVEEKVSLEENNIHEDVQRSVKREIKHIRETLSLSF